MFWWKSSKAYSGNTFLKRDFLFLLLTFSYFYIMINCTVFTAQLYGFAPQ